MPVQTERHLSLTPYFFDLSIGGQFYIELDGPCHFTSSGKRLGADVLKMWLFKKAGYRGIHISYKDWDKAKKDINVSNERLIKKMGALLEEKLRAEFGKDWLQKLKGEKEVQSLKAEPPKEKETVERRKERANRDVVIKPKPTPVKNAKIKRRSFISRMCSAFVFALWWVFTLKFILSLVPKKSIKPKVKKGIKKKKKKRR